MWRYSYQVYKTVTPITNSETGEISEDIICVKCNSNVNEETGELENVSKDLFKIPIQNVPVKKKTKVRMKCEMCKHGKYSILLLLVTFAVLLPAFALFLFLGIETMLHYYFHKVNSSHKYKATTFRAKVHWLLYSHFCAFCQSERSMNVVSKLQDERLERMRKYVKKIPIQ